MSKHFDGNIPCALDTETTGLQAGYHDIIQIAIIPLNYDFKIDKRFLPFDILIKPLRPDHIDYDAMTVNKKELKMVMSKGHDPIRAADLFDIWFRKLGLAEGKKIIPIAYNWPHDKQFIMEWLGKLNFEEKFHHYYRDLMAAIHFENDSAAFQCEQPSFTRFRLNQVAKHFGLDFGDNHLHDALDDARITAECYRLLCKQKMTNFQKSLIRLQADAIKELLQYIPEEKRGKYVRLTQELKDSVV